MDKEIFYLIKLEEKRQAKTLMMIPSENYASQAVRQALGSVLTNKYSEGYAGRRYYQGNQYVDEIERIAVERAKKLFGVPHANVQPYSGSPANAAVYFALLNPEDKIMGLSLQSGGHLTHGHPKITFSGKYFTSIQLNLSEEKLHNERTRVRKRCNFAGLDYAEIEEVALREKPRIIVSGTTAYPRILDFKKFGEIAERVGAWHLADISHVAGLVIAGAHPSPVPYADIVMTTTHKTLRGPRGAILMVTRRGLAKDEKLAEKIDRAVFPGLQGGPHNHVTAAMAVCLAEASKPSFKRYGRQVVENAKTLAKKLREDDFQLVTGGTDNHLLLIDLRNKKLDGYTVAVVLEEAGMVVNKNAIPNDPNPPFYPSGIRLGTPALTTRGMKEKEMKKIAGWINEVIDESSKLKAQSSKQAQNPKFKEKLRKNKKLKKIKQEVEKLCEKFPVP